jgi:2',3'-cyclic-nucleotide 2'-phosphodiesterase
VDGLGNYYFCKILHINWINILKNSIKVLFIGDIVGDPGISFLEKNMDMLKEKYSPEFIILNGENAQNGKGMSEAEVERFFAMKADVITTGNHIWDNWKSKPLLAKYKQIIRPLNYPPGNVGLGYTFVDLPNNVKIAVLQLQGRTFMPSIDCPFRAADYALNSITEKTKNIIVDFHADATAEKVAMGWHLDGRVSALLGTHTHIQTADATILPKGTCYITDVGMTGPYDSVVGMRKDVALKRFMMQTPHKYELAKDDVRISGVVLEIDLDSGMGIRIENFMYPKFEKSIFDGLENE